MVSVADSSSNFGDHVSASRASSEDFGDDVRLSNKMEQTKTGEVQKDERIHVEQVRDNMQTTSYRLSVISISSSFAVLRMVV